jgi:hypothetical protein
LTNSRLKTLKLRSRTCIEFNLHLNGRQRRSGTDSGVALACFLVVKWVLESSIKSRHEVVGKSEVF